MRGQLTQEASTRNGGYTNSFAYDGGSYTATTGVGNPTTMRGASPFYNADKQISTNAYDGEGNPTTYNGNTLTFDPENRLTGFNSAETNTYDGDDDLASTTTSSGTSYYIYDGGTPLLTEDSTGTITNVLTVGVNGVASTHSSSTGFYTWDPQGNLCQKLDSSGNVLETRSFDAFGNVSKSDSDTDPYAGFGGQWGYRLDSVTGLYQLGYRYYDPSTGRFINRDPIGYAGGLNVYAYTGNNPVNRVDPRGLCTLSIGVGANGGSGAFGSATGVSFNVAPSSGAFGMSFNSEYHVGPEYGYSLGPQVGYSPSGLPEGDGTGLTVGSNGYNGGTIWGGYGQGLGLSVTNPDPTSNFLPNLPAPAGNGSPITTGSQTSYSLSTPGPGVTVGGGAAYASGRSWSFSFNPTTLAKSIVNEVYTAVSNNESPW